MAPRDAHPLTTPPTHRRAPIQRCRCKRCRMPTRHSRPTRFLQALLTQPLNIIRIVPLVIFWVKSKLAATARAKVCASAGVEGGWHCGGLAPMQRHCMGTPPHGKRRWCWRGRLA